MNHDSICGINQVASFLRQKRSCSREIKTSSPGSDRNLTLETWGLDRVPTDPDLCMEDVRGRRIFIQSFSLTFIFKSREENRAVIWLGLRSNLKAYQWIKNICPHSLDTCFGFYCTFSLHLRTRMIALSF